MALTGGAGCVCNGCSRDHQPHPYPHVQRPSLGASPALVNQRLGSDRSEKHLVFGDMEVEEEQFSQKETDLGA